MFGRDCKAPLHPRTRFEDDSACCLLRPLEFFAIVSEWTVSVVVRGRRDHENTETNWPLNNFFTETSMSGLSFGCGMYVPYELFTWTQCGYRIYLPYPKHQGQSRTQPVLLVPNTSSCDSRLDFAVSLFCTRSGLIVY